MKCLLSILVISKRGHLPGLIINITMLQKSNWNFTLVLCRMLGGGRVSDKYLTEHCGILWKLLPGDIVLADRGFDIAEFVGSMQAKLHIPAFTKGKTQLSAIEVEETIKSENPRRVCNWSCSSKIPNFTEYVMRRNGKDIALIDCMVRVCCALNVTLLFPLINVLVLYISLYCF